MRKLLIIILFPIAIIHGQELDGINSIGFGWSNTGSIIGSTFNKSEVKPAFNIDYKNKYDSSKHYRFNLIFELPFRSNNATTFENLYFSIGIEKPMLVLEESKINLYYGCDIYYKMNLRKTKLYPISSYASGFGILALAGVELELKNNYSFCSEINFGFGAHQSEDGSADPNSGLILWYLDRRSTKNISLGIRKYF